LIQECEAISRSADKIPVYDILKYGKSRGELLCVGNAIGMDILIDEKAKEPRCSYTLDMMRKFDNC
jgi:hypothetical protein